MAVSGGTKGWARPEPGKMPAWQQDMLERKRQKMAGSVVLSSRGKDLSPSRSSRRGSPERLVLQDSLGPLHENPFIKQEKERRRRRPQYQSGTVGRSTSPIRHLLDLYGNVPGIRTIRAENIIIIESDPSYFTQSSHTAGAATPTDPLEELLAKRGSKVTEIRASEVVIYEPDPPGTEKKNQAPLRKESVEDNELLEEAGRVSRLLEKFDHGHSRPTRWRSWENLLEKEHKPPVLPKSPSAERAGQLPLMKAPKRSGELSQSSASILEEDCKRFPLNNPSWRPHKQSAVHSIPDPGLFHKRPSSPSTPPATIAPVSPSSPLSPRYEMFPNEKLLVASVREKFEVGYATNNHPLSKLVHVTQKTGSNTVVVNPKATSSTEGGVVKNPPLLVNGHVDHSEINSKTGAPINIQDLLNKSKRPRGSTSSRLSAEGSGVVPSPSISEVPKGANDWRPKSEVNQSRNSISPKPSAENTYPNHYEQGFHSATPSMLLKVSSSTSSNDSFEIRPAPKPDLSSIPEDNIQARALANIRMQSKNSFVFVPKKRQAPSEPKQGYVGHVPANDKPKVQVSASTFNGPKLDFTDSSTENDLRSKEGHAVVNGNDQVEQVTSPVSKKASSVPSLSDFDWKSGLLPSKTSKENQSFTDVGAELEYFSSMHHGDTVGVLTVPVTKIHEDVAKADIPVTNIDDVVNGNSQEFGKEVKPAVKPPTDSIVPPSRPHASLASVRTKGTNTFMVIPKRRPVTEQEAFRTPVVDEDDDEDARLKRKSSDGADPPYSEMGALLKKRYPTVDEIQVIGGYMSLSKSCLLKNGSTRKKMKISFNEQNIHTMFEYPSESSLAEDAGEEESGTESEEEDKPSLLFPRPAMMGNAGTGNGLRAKSPNSGLSNYTPKHSLEYSQWQDEKSQAPPSSPDPDQHTDMLTPADSNSHSDFRSEPALYF